MALDHSSPPQPPEPLSDNIDWTVVEQQWQRATTIKMREGWAALWAQVLLDSHRAATERAARLEAVLQEALDEDDEDNVQACWHKNARALLGVTA